MEIDRKIVTAAVRRNREIAADIFEMAIGAGAFDTYAPGQFINVYLDDKSLLLPRPVSVCDVEDGLLTIVYKIAGKGTARLSRYREGAPIRVCGPLGNGYCLETRYARKTVALAAGGIGIPPLIGLARALRARGAAIDVFLGFPSEVFLADRFEKLREKGGAPLRVFVATEDGNQGFHGDAVELLKNNGRVYDAYFACGPKGMLKALSDYAAEINRDVQVSIEERMGCGYGACVGCACTIREGNRVEKKRVCKDGPVFWGKDVIWDES